IAGDDDGNAVQAVDEQDLRYYNGHYYLSGWRTTTRAASLGRKERVRIRAAVLPNAKRRRSWLSCIPHGWSSQASSETKPSGVWAKSWPIPKVARISPTMLEHISSMPPAK